jgi:hypothetical protein
VLGEAGAELATRSPGDKPALHWETFSPSDVGEGRAELGELPESRFMTQTVSHWRRTLAKGWTTLGPVLDLR